MDYTSSGTILISFVNRKVLLVKHPEGHWGFPKGFIEKEETAYYAAKRELSEEVGIECNFYLNPNKYSFEEQYSFVNNQGITITKKVLYFIGVTCNTEYVLEKALKDCRWFELSELYALPNFKSAKIVNEIEHIIHKEICWVNCGDHNVYSVDEDVMPSKHIFSRVIPLLEFSDNIIIDNAPNILDSYYMYEIIRKSRALKHQPMILHEEDVNKCWSSVNILPFLVYNHKKVILESKPSGCKIGQRSIDLYLNIMQRFGYEVVMQDKEIIISFHKQEGDLEIELPFPSFTGTSVAIYCAMVNSGQTLLRNISLEPEILFLIEQVKSMGWKISLNDRILYIEQAPDNIEPIHITIPADRNVLVTKIVDALINNRQFYYSNNNGLFLSSLLLYFDQIGVKYEYDHKSILIYENQSSSLRSVPIVCGHYPALCSDWQPLLTYLMLMKAGKIKVTDNVFENRYGYFKQIETIYQNSVGIISGNTLEAKTSNITYDELPYDFDCLDIRASAVLFMLVENNFNVCVHNLTQLLRGYSSVNQVSNIADKLGFFEFI